MNKLKIGLIGCGKQAPKHISGLAKLPEVEIILADKNPAAAKSLSQESGLPWVEDVDAIFSDQKISAVDICTPTLTHYPLIIPALESGKDFFCEKPLCERLEDAKVICELVTTKQRIGMIGYVYRFAPIFEFGKKLFTGVPETGTSMELGKVVSALFRLGGRGAHQLWKHKIDQGGGAINEMLVHMLDLALWYFGPMQEVEVLTKNLLRSKRIIHGIEETVDAEDYVAVRMYAKSGVEILIHVDLMTPAFTQFVEIQGENGTFMGSIQPDMPSFLHCNEGVAGYQSGKTSLDFGKRNLFEAQMAEFIHAIRTQTPPANCTVQDSINLLKTMDLLKGNM